MRHIITSLALSTILFTGLHANAAPSSSAVRPYFGVDYGYLQIASKYKSIAAPHHYHGVIPHAGLRIGDFFGLEGGYLTTLNQTKRFKQGTAITSVKSHMKELYLDGHAYLPFSKEAEGIASIGLSKYIHTYPTYGSSINKPILRLGAGLQFHLDRNVSLRGMVHYNMPTKKIGHGGAIFMPTVGLNFTF